VCLKAGSECDVVRLVGLLAERSMPHTGGMDGVYRRRLLENGAWSVLVRAVRVTNFETERLEETVAAGLMYLSAEVPRLITAGEWLGPILFLRSSPPPVSLDCLPLYPWTHLLKPS
jgi:hypothetical protein